MDHVLMLVQTLQLQAQGLGLSPMQLLSLFPLPPFSRQLSLDLRVFAPT
jgi:hypothetical protein